MPKDWAKTVSCIHYFRLGRGYDWIRLPQALACYDRLENAAGYLRGGFLSRMRLFDQYLVCSIRFAEAILRLLLDRMRRFGLQWYPRLWLDANGK